MSGRPGFFDLSDRYDALSAAGDPLERLAAVVDFEDFRSPLIVALRRSVRGKGGRPPFGPVLMFKILVLQALYSLSDEATEFQIKDRLSFQRFLGLTARYPMRRPFDCSENGLCRPRRSTGCSLASMRHSRIGAIWRWVGRSSTPRSFQRPTSAISKPKRPRSRKAGCPKTGSRPKCGRRIAMPVGRPSTARPRSGRGRSQSHAGRSCHPDVRLQQSYRHRPGPRVDPHLGCQRCQCP